jgi:hypothetical protein
LLATVVRFDAGNPWGDPAWDGVPTYEIDPSWRPLAAEGMVGIVSGLVILITPVTGEQTLFVLIAAFAFASGVCQALSANQLGRLATGSAAMAVCAAISFAGCVIAIGTNYVALDDRIDALAGAAVVAAVALAAVGVSLVRQCRVAAVPRGTTVLAAELVDPVKVVLPAEVV